MRSIPGESAVTVRVVGATEPVVETIESAGHAVDRAVPTAIDASSSAPIVTVGESALLAVARRYPIAPILSVGTVIGPATGDSAAITAALDGGQEHARPLVEVSVDGEAVGDAFMDVTLVTSEPARISEYAIDGDDGRVATFRADGVVVTTPAGSLGYGAAAGGPTLSPTADVVSVVPIAPFHTRSNCWVLDTAPLSLSVLRDEGAVSLLIDDAEHGSVGPEQRVRLSVGGRVRTLHPSG